jgi:hypothetical protein
MLHYLIYTIKVNFTNINSKKCKIRENNIKYMNISVISRIYKTKTQIFNPKFLFHIYFAQIHSFFIQIRGSGYGDKIVY